MTDNFRASALHNPFWLPGGHLQTIAPRFFRQPEVRYRRELRADSTGRTQVAYDFIDGKEDAPLLVLFHGLEGGSGSHYAHWLMHAVARAGWHGVVAHFRSCGGVRNTAPVFYHSGDSAEIAFMLGGLKKDYPRIFAAGVSLGGNALAKYLGETRRPDCTAAAVVSAPVDLPQAGAALDTPFCRKVYVPYFLKTLIPKALENTQDAALKARLRQCRSLREFDNLFTAPLHGFASADEYYRLSSARPLLKNIAVPTLLLNAQNDPFFPAPYLPRREEVSPAVTLLQPAGGGHAGFYCAHRAEPLMWLPQTLLDFFRAAENTVQAA